MIDPSKVDLNQLPKKFCDGAIGAYNKDTFVMAFTSGNELSPFVTTPQIAKSIATWLTGNVEKYEKTYGEIDMSEPLVPSPIQSSDLNNQ